MKNLRKNLITSFGEQPYYSKKESYASKMTIKGSVPFENISPNFKTLSDEKYSLSFPELQPVSERGSVIIMPPADEPYNTPHRPRCKEFDNHKMLINEHHNKSFFY